MNAGGPTVMECFRLLLAVLAALAGARVAVCPVVGRGARPDGAARLL
jgi:hypothetical protein